jgi:hypothetical protein
MSGEVADFSVQDENVLLNLDRAHKAFEKVQAEYGEAMDAARVKVTEQYNPLFYEAQSVLYEAMGKASKAGFSDAQMAQTMQCGVH